MHVDGGTSLRVTVVAAFLAAAAADCVSRKMPEESSGLDCVLDFRAPVTECAHVDRQLVDRPTTSDGRELHIRGVEVRRDGDTLVADVDLAGRFSHDPDQNIYLFLGAPTGAATPTTYALTQDPAHFEDAGFPVRGALTFPHRNDVRVAVLSVVPAGYSPQVYLHDQRAADAVGPDSGVVQHVQGSRVHIEIPLARHYQKRGEPVPPDIAVTVATARDYVGFIDQATAFLPAATALLPATASRAQGGTPAPADYPTLDPDAHILRAVRLVQSDGGLAIEIDTRAPIRDWAQTNLHVFLLPVEPFPTTARLLDPSRTRTIPYKWSLYCGVYSPRRVFCKRSEGKDFTFDNSYSERASLPPPEGAKLRVVEDGRYALDLSPEAVFLARAGRPTFAVMVSLGRDGFAPTSWYGASGTGGPKPP